MKAILTIGNDTHNIKGKDWTEIEEKAKEYYSLVECDKDWCEL